MKVTLLPESGPLSPQALANFFSWWKQGLCFGRLGDSARIQRRRADAIVTIAATQIAFRPARAAEATRQFALNDDNLPVLSGFRRWHMAVSDAHVLSQKMTLPRMSPQEYEAAILYELQGMTPFALSDLLHGYRLTPLADGRVQAHVYAMPRRLFDHFDTRISQALGARAAYAYPADDPQVELLHKRPPVGQRWWRALRWTLLMLAVLVALAALVAPVAKQEWLLYRLEPDMAAAQNRASAVARIRERLEALEQTLGEAVAARREQTDMNSLLEEVTRHTPEHSWYESLSVNDGVLRLNGYSRETADLVQELDSSALLATPEFTGPLTPTRTPGEERFGLRVPLIDKEPP